MEQIQCLFVKAFDMKLSNICNTNILIQPDRFSELVSK